MILIWWPKSEVFFCVQFKMFTQFNEPIKLDWKSLEDISSALQTFILLQYEDGKATEFSFKTGETLQVLLVQSQRVTHPETEVLVPQYHILTSALSVVNHRWNTSGMFSFARNVSKTWVKILPTAAVASACTMKFFWAMTISCCENNELITQTLNRKTCGTAA